MNVFIMFSEYGMVCGPEGSINATIAEVENSVEDFIWTEQWYFWLYLHIVELDKCFPE